MSKRLVILTTHFGTNFSGGSTATCEIFSRLEHHFDQIVVIGTELGEHPFQKLHFEKYGNRRTLFGLIKKYQTDYTINYGDFFNSTAFADCNVPFYFTYHDNWPELGKASFSQWLQGFKYIPAYKKIFSAASHTFTVSEFKMNYVSQHSSSATLIRNGFRKVARTSKTQQERQNILMVGNIDERKYKLALKLFKVWQPECEIHIYGRVTDQHLADKLSNHSFITLKGFIDSIPYEDYKIMLHTSQMENLPISFCEAIHQNTPVVAFDVGGINEIIDSSNGLLAKAYDIKQLAEHCDRAYNSYGSFEFDDDQLQPYSWDKAAEHYRSIMIE